MRVSRRPRRSSGSGGERDPPGFDSACGNCLSRRSRPFLTVAEMDAPVADYAAGAVMNQPGASGGYRTIGTGGETPGHGLPGSLGHRIPPLPRRMLLIHYPSHRTSHLVDRIERDIGGPQRHRRLNAQDAPCPPGGAPLLGSHTRWARNHAGNHHDRQPQVAVHPGATPRNLGCVSAWTLIGDDISETGQFEVGLFCCLLVCSLPLHDVCWVSATGLSLYRLANRCASLRVSLRRRFLSTACWVSGVQKILRFCRARVTAV